MFDNAVFSNDGLELLGQLTATKTLVIREVYADTAQLDASLVNNSVEWWETQTAPTMQNIVAACEAASKFDGQARLLLTFGGSEATVKTIVVTACAVESGVYTNDVVLCMASDDVGIKVFDTTSMYVYTNVALMIKFSNASSISIQGVSSTEFALQGDLDRLVSCHKAGDPSTGEAQTILGNKTFKHNISAHIAGFARINAENVGDTIIVGNTMHPTVAKTDLGTADFPFNTLYIDSFKVNKNITLSAVGEDKTTYTTVITPEKLTCTNTYGIIATPIVTEFKYSKNDLYIARDGNKLINITYDLSSDSYTTAIAGDTVSIIGYNFTKATGHDGLQFDGHLTVTDGMYVTGSVSCQDLHSSGGLEVNGKSWLDGDINTYGNLDVSGDTKLEGSLTVGNSTITKWDTVVLADANTNFGYLQLAIGQIVEVYMDYLTISGTTLPKTYYVGTKFVITSDTTVHPSLITSGSPSTRAPDTKYKLPEGTYQILSTVTFTNTIGISVLMQRIS